MWVKSGLKNTASSSPIFKNEVSMNLAHLLVAIVRCVYVRRRFSTDYDCSPREKWGVCLGSGMGGRDVKEGVRLQKKI